MRWRLWGILHGGGVIAAVIASVGRLVGVLRSVGGLSSGTIRWLLRWPVGLLPLLLLLTLLLLLSVAAGAKTEREG